MKKILAIILAAVMVMSLAGCGDAKNPAPEGTEAPEVQTPSGDGEADAEPEGGEVVPEENMSALDLFTEIWNSIPEDKRPMAFGGDYNEENQVENAPGKHEIGDGTELDSGFGFPTDLADKVSEAAAVRHMLNVNSLSAAMYYIEDANTDVIPDLAQGIRDSLMNRSYMCGWPEVLVVMKVGSNYVLSAYGNSDLVYALKDAAEASQLGSEVLFDESMEDAGGDNTFAIPVPELG